MRIEIWANPWLGEEPRMLAWAADYRLGPHNPEDEHILVGVPHLYLSHAATLSLVSNRSYPKLFEGARIHVPGMMPRPFHIVRAEFPLWRTGEAEIRSFAAVAYVTNPAIDTVHFIAAASALLGGRPEKE